MRVNIGDLVRAKPHIVEDARVTSYWSVHDTLYYETYKKHVGIVVSLTTPLFSEFIVRVWYPATNVTTYFHWPDECFVLKDGVWVDPKGLDCESG